MNSEAQSAMRTAAQALGAVIHGRAGGELQRTEFLQQFRESAASPSPTSIGAQPTSADGADPVAVTVRSQSQVTLTEQYTPAADMAGAAAIATFVRGRKPMWRQRRRCELLYLDSDTRDLQRLHDSGCPDTTLHFTLTVTTAGNAAATAHVTLLVKAVNDPNQFLAMPSTSLHHFQVAVATVEGLTAPLAVDAPVCITLNREIHYTSRDGSVHDGSNSAYPPVKLPPLKRDTAWNKSIGGVANDLTSYTNPKVAFDIPALNQDDVDVLFNNPASGTTATANLNQQLVPSDIGKAQLSVTATVAPGSCDGTLTATALAAKTLKLAAQDAVWSRYRRTRMAMRAPGATGSNHGGVYPG